jgi:hypothetical protein
MTKAQQAAIATTGLITDDQVRAMPASTYTAYVRKALRALGFAGSVKSARGTAYGWVEIWGDPNGAQFSPTDRRLLDDVGIGAGGNCSVISPDSRVHVARLLRGYIARHHGVGVATPIALPTPPPSRA